MIQHVSANLNERRLITAQLILMETVGMPIASMLFFSDELFYWKKFHTAWNFSPVEAKKLFEMSDISGEQKLHCVHEPFPNLRKLRKKKLTGRIWTVLTYTNINSWKGVNGPTFSLVAVCLIKPIVLWNVSHFWEVAHLSLKAAGVPYSCSFPLVL